MAFPPSFLDELRNRIPLASLVGRQVRLIRRGRELAGLCPVHPEKTPAFFVVEDKGFFHFFGFRAAGDGGGYLVGGRKRRFLQGGQGLGTESRLPAPAAA